MGRMLQEVIFMKNVKVFLIVFLSAIAIIPLAACASKPADELEMARVAMDKAISNQASEYAPYDWDRARMNWQMANALIQMGRYNEARSILIQAVKNFDKAGDESKRRLESLTVDINSMLPQLKKEALNIQHAAENPKINSRIRRRIDAALPLIDEKISTMNAHIDKKDYLQARMVGAEAMRFMQDLEKKYGIDQG